MRLAQFFLMAAGVAVPLCAAGQTNQVKTNLLAARPAEAAQKKLLPAPRFAHSASIRPAGAKQEVPAGASMTNAPATAISAPPPSVRHLKYELVPMNTDELAERRAVIGWISKPRKNR